MKPVLGGELGHAEGERAKCAEEAITLDDCEWLRARPGIAIAAVRAPLMPDAVPGPPAVTPEVVAPASKPSMSMSSPIAMELASS